MSIAEKLTTIAQNQEKVHNAGKDSEWNAFWDSYQNNGKRIGYYYGFCGLGWSDETFKPKYDIKASGTGAYMFIYNAVTDIKGKLEELGVRLDTSKVNNFQSSFAYSKSIAYPVLDFSNATSTNVAFSDCTNLQYIEKIIVAPKVSFNGTFKNCTSLEHIRIEGTIGQSIDFSYSPLLSRASIENIIGCLSGTVTGKTLTLSQTAVNNAFTVDEWNTLIEGKTNWTISLV